MRSSCTPRMSTTRRSSSASCGAPTGSTRPRATGRTTARACATRSTPSACTATAASSSRR
eukprot:288571-Prymnesium_polylepis.1